MRRRYRAGQVFGRWTIIAIRSQGRQTIATCKCQCGTVRDIYAGNLGFGTSKSCGCYRVDWTRQKFTTHGRSHTRLHHIWKGMRARCANPNHKNYSDYGGRGIQVCERWHTFENFLHDMEPNYKPGLSIDRIDNDGPYSPENCRWSSVRQQLRNKRNTVWITLRGETRCMEDWIRISGLSFGTVRSRIRRGWSYEDALFLPVDTSRRTHHQSTHDGIRIKIGNKTRFVSEWATIYEIDRRTIYSRILRGWSYVDAVTCPAK